MPRYVPKASHLVHAPHVIVSLVPPREPMDRPLTARIGARKWTLLRMYTSVVAIQFRFASEFLVAVLIFTDINSPRLYPEGDVVGDVGKMSASYRYSFVVAMLELWCCRIRSVVKIWWNRLEGEGIVEKSRRVLCVRCEIEAMAG
jgi:hypothetical protein